MEGIKNGLRVLTLITLKARISKGKDVPIHAVKAYRGRRAIARLILNLDTGRR